MLEFTTDERTAGLRPDRALRVVSTALDRDTALAALKDGRIEVNGEVANLRTQLNAGDVVRARVPKVRSGPGALPPGVLMLDADLMVVNKPAGVATHPADGVPENDTAVERAAALLASRGITPERPPAAAGRLDRGTSGILILTLSRAGERGMARLFEADGVDKTYLALVHGVTEPTFDVDDPLTVTRYRRGEPKVVKEKTAHTAFVRLASGLGACVVQARPTTGRLHQIRRHLRSAEHPIVGDGRHGLRQDRGSIAFFLHCARVGFQHPVTGAALAFALPPPDAFVEAVRARGIPWPPPALLRA
jgi:RluA family pseudouridine synthase